MNLVTGATGFVGSYIVRELVNRGEKVRALRRSNSSVELLKDLEGKFEWVEGDVLDVVSLEEAMQDVRKVYHSAAMISFLSNEISLMYKINIEGTANVVNACLNAGVEKLLHVSSITSLGISKENDLLNESKKWKEDKKNSAYSISKFRSELEIWRGQEEGLNVLIALPSTVLGYGNWLTGSSQIFKQIYDGIPYYPNGSNGYVSAADVARACADLMNSSLSGERFIINGENLSYKNLFEIIAKGFGVKAPDKPMPDFIGTIGWMYYWLKSKLLGQQPLITRETLKLTNSRYQYSNEKLVKALNFEFTPIEKVVKETCDKYLAAKK